MPTSGVRLARTSDVDDVASVNIRAWADRFAGVIPDHTLAGLRSDDLAMVWASGILNPPSTRHRLLVAVDADVLVGYAAIGPGQDPDADGETGELIALEVDPSRVRRGHGSRLLAAAVDHATLVGFQTLVVWCPLADETRRGFLQSAGFGPDAAYRDLAVGTGDDGAEWVVREVRLVTCVTGS